MGFVLGFGLVAFWHCFYFVKFECGGVLQRWINFFLGARLGHAIKRALKTKIHVLETTTNTAFCSLLSKCHLQLSFLMCFHQKFTQCGFFSLNVVLTSKIRYFSKNKVHNSKASVWKVFRRICWKHGILLKLKSATDNNALIIISRKLFKQIFFRTAPDRYFW